MLSVDAQEAARREDKISIEISSCRWGVRKLLTISPSYLITPSTNLSPKVGCLRWTVSKASNEAFNEVVTLTRDELLIGFELYHVGQKGDGLNLNHNKVNIPITHKVRAVPAR